MPVTLKPEAISAADCISEEEWRSSTPASFTPDRPVLYAQAQLCDIVASKRDLGLSDELSSFWSRANPNVRASSDTSPVEAWARLESHGLVAMHGVEVLVTSEALMLVHKHHTADTSANTPHTMTLSITYPAICLHATTRLATTTPATQPATNGSARPFPAYALNTPSDTSDAEAVQAIYLAIDPSHHLRSSQNPDHEEAASEELTLYIVPQSDSISSAVLATSVASIFAALSSCADLYPDSDASDAESDMDEPGEIIGESLDAPNGGQWFTADNAHEFTGFAEGVQVSTEELADGRIRFLGPGAGTRRERVDGDEVDGDGEDETKWARTG